MNLQKLNPLSLFFLLIIVFITSKRTHADDGPVYVNPNDPVQLVQPTKIGGANAVNYMTQTVYGFLDFTTTIGNTVMVFSPQSAPPPELPKPTKPPAPIVNTIIETKPPSTEQNFIVNEIKPSKTITKTTVQEKPAKSSLSSVVHVVANTPKKSSPKSSKIQLVSSHVEIHADTVTKHNNPNIPSSQKNIKLNNKSKSPIVIASHVEVKTEPKPTIVAAVNKPILYSSVVEVHSSDNNNNDNDNNNNENHSDDQENEHDDSSQAILQTENDLVEPEYDFLSRQPSEFAEETFLVHDIKPSNTKPIQKSRIPNEPKKNSNNNNNNNNNNRNKGNSNSNNNSNSNKNASNKRNDVHPTGLVTKLGGTVVKDGRTTVHETSVIGTFISGKYAQVLQSTSHIFNNNAAANKPKIVPSQSLRILKTAAPHNPKNQQQQQQQQTHHFQPQQHQTTTPKYLNHETVQLPVEHELHGNSPSPNLVRSSRRPASAQSSFKNRFRNRNSKDDNDLQDIYEPVHPVTSPTTFGNGGKKGGKNNNKHKTNRYNRFSTSSVELATVSVLSETATPAYVSRRTNKGPRNGFKPSNGFTPDNSNNNNNNNNNNNQNNNNNGNGYSRRFKPKLQPTPVAALDGEQQTSSLYKFKLNRAPGRWQYKTSPKPKVTIRKQNGESGDQEQPTQASPIYDNTSPLGPISNDINARSDDVDLDSSGSVHGDVLNHDVNTLDNVIESKRLPVETLNVEISTPVDFRDTYYEIATIKTPYTFQVGSVKNTRYITVTSTFEKTLDPEPTVTTILNEPLTENILATTAHIDKEHNLLDSSIATLPPILLSSDVETPPLETLTETFSTTQVMLKTHILPVLRQGHNATSYTLTQTYHITRLVTATKTLPPMDAYQFNPSKALKEFNSKLDEAGSELNLELEFGDDNQEDDDDDDDNDNDGVRIALPDDLDLSNIGSDFKLSEVDKSNIPEAHLRPKKKHSQKQQQQHQQLTTPIPSVMPNLSPEQLQQLAILQYLNPAAAAQLQQAAGIGGLQSSRPVIKLETIYESHVIPIFNGQSTSFSTISRPVATISKTEYEIVTTALPQIQQIPQFGQPQLNPLFQQPQQQQQQQQQIQITTAPIITQTMLTQTSSKVLKLTFGAKTAYTTIFSTTVVPTLLTTYITQSVQVQPTAAFPGFYPPPYGPYGPYVG